MSKTPRTKHVNAAEVLKDQYRWVAVQGPPFGPQKLASARTFVRRGDAEEHTAAGYVPLRVKLVPVEDYDEG